jgi:hypothetical protein
MTHIQHRVEPSTSVGPGRERSQMAQQNLSLLLCNELFAGEAMAYRRWLLSLPRIGEFSAHLPGENASLDDLVYSSIQLLKNRGLLDAVFFQHLAWARPSQRTLIAAVMQECLPGSSLDQSAGAGPVSLSRDEIFDLTPYLLDGTQRLSIGDGPTVKHGCTLLALGTGHTSIWDLERPFSPPLRLHLGPRSVLSVAAPHYLTHARMRKAQSIALLDGPEEVTATQSQPSLRRATLHINRGVIDRERRRFELAQGFCFSVACQLDGAVVALHNPESDATLIIWLQDPQ